MKVVIQDSRLATVEIVILVTIGLLFTIGLSGCPKSSPPKPDEQTSTKANEPAPLLEGWTDPRAVLVFSGDEHGYLEPCGCSERQSGGFARRADLFEQLREERGWSVSAFDVGGILDPERVTDPQSLIKFSTMLDGFNRMGYQGLTLGQEELMLGPAALFEEHTKVSSEEGFDVPFLASNVTLYGTPELGTPIKSRIVEVGNARIGVIGVVGQSAIKELSDSGRLSDENELKIDPPTDVLQSAIDDIKVESPDLIVLMSHAEIDESKQLAEKYPEIPVIVTAGSAEDPRPKPDYVGETMIVSVGKKGKNVAVVGLFDEGKLKHELVELDMDRFDSHPEMTDLMRDYQDDLKAAFDDLTSDDLAIAHPSGSTYVGSDSCKDCHKQAYGVWDDSKHFHALKSLTEGREKYEGEWVDRIYDPECLACHSTGWDPQRAWRYKSGFVSKEKTPHLAGQQCENCHGPASEHLEFELAAKQNGKLSQREEYDRTQAMVALRLNLKEAEVKVCSKCHDHDNSPNFDFETYWKKINHSGMRK